MNLLLLLPENMQSETLAQVSGRQLKHLHTTLTSKVGDHLCVGLLNDKIGTAEVTQLDTQQVTLEIDWHSEAPAALPLTLIIGLPRPKMLKRIMEQAKDTQLPEIHLKRRFKPFVEDELPTISQNTRKLLAHPGEPTACPINIQEQTTLVIGPEGGFTPYEVEKFKECDFESVHLGERILRVETAVPALIARLFCPV